MYKKNCKLLPHVTLAVVVSLPIFPSFKLFLLFAIAHDCCNRIHHTRIKEKVQEEESGEDRREEKKEGFIIDMHRLLVARLPLSRSLLLPIPVVQTVVGSDASLSLPGKLSALSTPEQIARRGAVARGGLSRRLRSQHHRCLSVGEISTPEPVPMEGEGIEHEKSQDILKKDQHPLSRYVQVTDDQSMVFLCALASMSGI